MRPDSPETLYLLAQILTNESRPLDALDLLLRAHKIAPENTDVIFLMAQVSMSQNYFEDAIPLLESGLQAAPRRIDLMAALGESYFMAGKVDKAIEEFKKLLDLEGSARSYAFLGLSYRNLGRFDEAKQYFQQGSNWIHVTAPAFSTLDLSPSGKAIRQKRKKCFRRRYAGIRSTPTRC